jgi:tRNA (guanine-N7-)-methyltransferase
MNIPDLSNPKKTDFSYREDFEYKSRNPYHQKLEEFEDFVLRNKDAEVLKGKWAEDFFYNQKPINLEIGTGYGHFMLNFCQDFSEQNFIGMDYRFKRSFTLAKKLSKINPKNFCYLRAKAERIEFLFEADELNNIFYFFPDPWPKTKHQKKRLFQGPFLKACLKVLKPGGHLHVKTDHLEYFKWMIEHVENFKGVDNKKFEVKLLTFDLDQEEGEILMKQYPTKFEKIFRDQGTKPKALLLECNLVS